MDLKFISEFAGLAYCLHPKSLSLFILSHQGTALIVSEIDLYTKAVCRTYNPPQLQPDTSYATKAANRYEKYVLSFVASSNQIVLVYPYGYAAFFDYQSTVLVNVVYMHGKHIYFPETFCIFDKGLNETMFFYTAEALSPIYMIEWKSTGTSSIQPAKKIPKSSHTIAVQLACHPKVPLVYGACSDGCVHVWDYKNAKEIEMLIPSKYTPNKSISVGGSLSIDPHFLKLLYGNSYGFLSVWDISNPSTKPLEECLIQKPFGIETVNWLPVFRSEKQQLFAIAFSNGSLAIYNYIYPEDRLKAKFEEVCTLFQGEGNISVPLNVDRTGFIMAHPAFPFIVSVWPKFKGLGLLKSTAFMLYQTISQSSELSRASRIGSLPLTEYNPDNSLKAEPYIFYIQSDKIFAYSTVECKAQAVIDLRKSFNISIVSYQKFDSRPKGVTEPAKTYRFMVLCTLGTGEEICALLSYDVVEGKLSEPIKQTAACDACFLGTESEQNPAVVLLGISRQHVTISTFAKSEHKYAEAPADKIELRGKARSLYRTPLNSGITVVYQSYGEHALKFSQNRAEGASKWNLAFLNDSNISMRLKYDEIAFDVVWQNEALCAVTTNQRVIIANNKLKILYEYNLANLELSSTVTSSWWLGNSLLFTNYTHLFYVVPEHPFVPHAVMSLPESRILVGSLLDRVFTFREDVGGAAIKILPVVLNEPLIVGYLASLGKKIEKEKVAELVVKLNGGLISNNLIKALNTVGMSYSAMDLVSKPSNPQFTEKDKVEQAVRQKDSSKAIELITGIKEINNPPEHAVTESMLRARSDPTYKFEKHQLKQTLQAALIMGQYKIAYLCAELLNDQKTGYRVLSGYNAASKLVKSLKPESKVAEQVMATDLECSINAVEGTKKKIRHEENTLRNWKVEPATINEVIKRPRTTHHGVLGIKMEDKKILYFTQYISQDRSVESKDLPAIRDASLGEWLGYDLVVSSLSLPEKIPDQIFQEQQSSEVPLLPEDTTADNFAESDYLLCYYRLDEGPRSKELIDASDKKINASLIAPESAYETIWGEELGLGEPLDYEDRWGVKAMPNRSLRVNSENTYIKIKATEKTAIMKSTFTLEMWTKFDDLEKKNCILQSSKNSLNVAVARETITVTNGKKQINISLDKAIIEKAWTHLAIVWHCNAPVPIQVLVDGKIAGNTKEKLSNQNWAKEDLILCKFEGEVTEIRIWGTNLNEKIIAGNKKVPLSILSNRQSMIQLTIKRQAKEPAVEKKKTGILAPHKKSALAPPPKGGLKKPGLKKPPSKEPVVKPAEKEEEKVTSSQRSSNVGKSFELSESSGSPSIWSSSSGGKDKLERTSIEKANPHVETRSEPTSTSTKVSILSDVVNHITTGNLAATMTTIEEHLKRFAAKPMLDASDKKVFAQLSRYKFIVKALSVIHQLRLNEDQASIQQSADLANVVVVIKTSRKVKPNLYKLAVFLLTLNTILP